MRGMGVVERDGEREEKKGAAWGMTSGREGNSRERHGRCLERERGRSSRKQHGGCIQRERGAVGSSMGDVARASEWTEGTTRGMSTESESEDNRR